MIQLVYKLLQMDNILLSSQILRQSGHDANRPGTHIVPGLGCFWLTAALFCWLPWLKTSKNANQSIIFCATDPSVSEQSGFYYSECGVQLTNEAASKMDDAYRLWEMSERMAGLTS
jgi:hypothetical protein